MGWSGGQSSGASVVGSCRAEPGLAYKSARSADVGSQVPGSRKQVPCRCQGPPQYSSCCCLGSTASYTLTVKQHNCLLQDATQPHAASSCCYTHDCCLYPDAMLTLKPLCGLLVRRITGQSDVRHDSSCTWRQQQQMAARQPGCGKGSKWLAVDGGYQQDSRHAAQQ